MRHFSAYEINHLLKYGFDISNLGQYGDMPVEYITGHAEFLNQDFLVNQHTLIPRVETEVLVEKAGLYCRRTFEHSSHLTIADIGTGSGCIGISLWLDLSTSFDSLTIILSDISDSALKVASQNRAQHIPPSHQHQVKTLQSDLLLDYPESIDIDVIVANLPYIPHDRIDQLDPSVKEHEPFLALDGKDPKGLGVIRSLIEQSLKLTTRPRAIFLEIDEFVQLQDLPQTNWYQSTIIKDQFEKNRFALYERVTTETT